MLIFLSILMKIILSILVMALILVMCTLFVPIRYDVRIVKAESLFIIIKATWLLKIVRLNYEPPDGIKIIIFNIRLKQKKEPFSQSEADNTTKPPDKANQNTQKQKGSVKEKHKAKKTYKEEKNSIFSQIKYILNRIMSAIKHPDRAEITNLTIKLIRELFGAMKNIKILISGEIGLDTPAYTGYLFAVSGMTSAFTGIDIKLKGNFEKAIQNIEIRATGKFNLWSLLWPIVKYILAKPIWKIVRTIFFSGDDVDEQ